MIILKRRPGPHTDGLQPGFYAKSLDPRPDRCGWCIVRCPKCERLMTIGINHRVTADGTVRPSLVCPYDCTFHAFVRLDNWAD